MIVNLTVYTNVDSSGTPYDIGIIEIPTKFMSKQRHKDVGAWLDVQWNMWKNVDRTPDSDSQFVTWLIKKFPEIRRVKNVTTVTLER